MKRVNSVFVFIFLVFAVNGQTDTVVLNESAFLKQALKFSPVASNSFLNIELQNKELLESRGAFEPKLDGDFSRKAFDDKLYYNKQGVGVKAKTPLGISLSGGLEDNFGVFLNPEGNLPAQGLAYAGIEISLGAGLFTDQERTDVKQKRIELDAAQLQNTLTLNDYALDAGKVFWEWYGSILLLRVSQEAVSQAKNRLDFVKRKYAIGETANIDTLEAFINYQNRQAYNLANQIKWFKLSKYLSNFTWEPDLKNKLLVPEVDADYEATFPDSSRNSTYILNHPLVSLLEADSMVNSVNMALVREYLKPTVDLAFKMQESTIDLGEFNFDPLQNNYVGLNVSMPFLQRKQRAKSSQLSIKNEMIAFKKQEVIVKVDNNQRVSLVNSQTLRQSSLLWSDATKNYKRLLNAERTKFNLGESSLFIVNNRELKWIDAREKYIKNYVDFRIEVLKYYHSLGLLPQILQN